MSIAAPNRSSINWSGAWLRVNGAAIYGTRPFTVFGEGPTKGHGDSTQKNKDIQVYTAQDIRSTTSKIRLNGLCHGAWVADGRQPYIAHVVLRESLSFWAGLRS